MFDIKEYKYLKINFIQSSSADPAPPLGTVLGNLGVNTTSFCTQFNNFTSKLPSYFLLRVYIYIASNKSFKFNIKLPTTSFILNLLKFELTIKVHIHGKLQEKIIVCVKLFSLVKLAKFKFPKLDLIHSLPIVFGTAKSFNIQVVR